jgi:protein-tyrosine-phosphatase/DNA-binding transcriptional ArsR family regulator
MQCEGLRYDRLVPRTVGSHRRSAAPPTFVRLVAHPLRWGLLQELVESDRAVWELMELVGEGQSLVSYHLRQLREGGLVSVRRSSADRRDSFYAIDLGRCREQLQAAAGALHPGLSPPPESEMPTRRSGRRQRVLFLCTGNSARSQMAEGLLERLSHGGIDADSAGSNPKPLHANAVRVMQRRGIDISQNRTKHVRELSRRRFDIVITLCDRVREVCPELPSRPRRAHWSIADPALEGADDRVSYPAFERTAVELETRIGFLLHQMNQRPTRRSEHADG